MRSKWIIEGFKDYKIGEDGNIYKLPFFSKGKWYQCRVVKEQYPNRFRLNNSWWTKEQLRGKIKKDLNVSQLFVEKSDCPF